MRRSGYCRKPKPDRFTQGPIRTDHIPHRGEKDMMTKSTVVAVLAFSLAIGAGAALAQNPPPAADQAPAAAPAASADKAAISKACSEQATAKGLHGKERKKFKRKCKRKGGKME
jgi:psiF repeat-containing protein